MDSNKTPSSICFFVRLMRFLETEVDAVDVEGGFSDADDVESEFSDDVELSCD